MTAERRAPSPDEGDISEAPALGLRRRVVPAPGGPLTLFESADVDRDLDHAISRGGPAPYGRVLWPSAPVVAAEIAGLALAGRRVLELGCGTGLVSLVAARAGAFVLATDVDEGALAAVRAAAHALGPVAGSLHIDTFDVLGGSPLAAADIVVVADLLYEEPLARAVARRALEAKQRGATVIVGDPARVFRDAFLSTLAAGGVIARFAPRGGSAEGGDVAVCVL